MHHPLRDENRRASRNSNTSELCILDRFSAKKPGWRIEAHRFPEHHLREDEVVQIFCFRKSVAEHSIDRLFDRILEDVRALL